MADGGGKGFLATVFLAVASCTLVHFGFILTGFEDTIHTMADGFMGSGGEDALLADAGGGGHGHDHPPPELAPNGKPYMNMGMFPRPGG